MVLNTIVLWPDRLSPLQMPSRSQQALRLCHLFHPSDSRFLDPNVNILLIDLHLVDLFAYRWQQIIDDNEKRHQQRKPRDDFDK